MSETLKKLQEIGIDEIHAKTHISIHSLKAILEERFADISHIQYIGFLTLIEAEMHLSMDELRDSYQTYREDTGQIDDSRELFITTPTESKNHKPLIISIIAVLLIILFVSTFSSNKAESEESIEAQVQNSAIEDATKHLSSKTLDPSQETRLETVPTFNASQAQADERESNSTHPFALYPKESLWIGVINIDTDKQRDTITSAPYVLDENANLLISLGHGMVKIVLNGDTQNLSDAGRVRFIYKNGELSRISLAKFKELNKGKSW